MIKQIQQFLFVLTLFAGFTSFAAASSNAAPGKVLVVLGDSIAAGYGLDLEEAFPALLQEKAKAAGLNITVKNAGLSGDTTAGGLRRLNWILRQQVDYLLIELGGNDGLRGVDPSETAKNLQGMIDLARKQKPGITIFIAGMQMPANMGEDYTRAYRETFSKVAEKNKCILIPFLLEGVGGKSELNQPDRIHPTAAGHKIIAETVWKVVGPVLSQAKDS
ncbi:MAG: arylesterase [Verrucomicrobiales bacterium]